VVDVPASSGGRILRVLLNADLDEGIGILASPEERDHRHTPAARRAVSQPTSEHWRWRLAMVHRLGSELDPARFGVEALYVFGSTKNATAGPGSDIDLLVHFRGTGAQRKELEAWLQGWSLCLAEQNYLRTGYKSEGLLDVHMLTDEDFARRSSWASKIGAVTDPAHEIPLNKPK
jgi:hypothetical protein